MKYRIQRTPIIARQYGAARRHRWYRALGDARAIRRARSHAATYRALNQRRRRLYDLAARDRQMSDTRYTHGARWHAVTDPIQAEIYRIRCELYCALVKTCDPEAAFQAHYARAAASCERYNTAQAAQNKGRTSWHMTDIGSFSPDEAWRQLRHAIRMYRTIVETHDAP